MKKRNFVIICVVLIILLIVLFLILLIHNGNEKDFSTEKMNIQESTINSTYDNPIIPQGFMTVETSTASWQLENDVPKGWNKGLVIEDDIGNQFVWVPANKIEKDIYSVESKDIEQINKYGGFYIARYEAGIPEEYIETINDNELRTTTNNNEGIPTSKKDQIPWNYINTENAKKNAMKMYNNKYIQSDIITVRQWNIVMQWLSDGGYNTKDSFEWGNYSDASFQFTGYYSIDSKSYKYGENITKSEDMILSTGSTERNMSNNIYDLAGNLAEYTQDIDNEIRNIRGGYYTKRSLYNNNEKYLNEDQYSSNSASSGLYRDKSNDKQGFRVVLYLK